MTTLFLADWVNVLFAHFEADPEQLAREVPLELDLYNGKAYVSLVAFTQKRLRPKFGGRLGEWLSSPLAQHEFLNVRTYVRLGSERGIYFMVEWVPSSLAKFIGPLTYGLPYRLGRMNYKLGDGEMRGLVEADGRLEFQASMGEATARCQADSLEEFLLERYTAFTSRNGVLRRFRIRHEPWPKAPAECRITHDSLLSSRGWMVSTQPVVSHYSPGVRDVQIGGPQRISVTAKAAHRRAPPSLIAQ